MDEDTREALRAALKAAYDDAVSYDENELSPRREEALRFFNGEKFGVLAAEEEGRSSYVHPVVRDTMQSMMPHLLRPFVSNADRVFSYAPRRASAVEQAGMVTAYINDVVMQQDNEGHRVLYSAIWDAMLSPVGGIVRAEWEESAEPEYSRHTGLSPEAVAMLLADTDGWDVEAIEQTVTVCGCDDLPKDHRKHLEAMAQAGEPLPPPGGAFALPTALSQAAAGALPAEGMGMPTPGMPDASGAFPVAPPAMVEMPLEAKVSIDLTIRRTRRAGQARVVNVPPHEFLIERAATSIPMAGFVGQRSLRTVSELVALGYDRDTLEQFASADPDDLGNHTERLARNPALYDVAGGHSPDPAMRTVEFLDAFIRFDADDDGIAELHRVCAVGGAAEILHVETVAESPFAQFLIDPIPHTHLGRTIADAVGDLQVITSFIMRNVLDSLAQSIHPRTIFVEGQVNVDDLLNKEAGGMIRARAPGMVQELQSSFAGQSALPVLALLEDARAGRTGISRASQGLDPDVLQSTTASAVNAVTEAASARLEMLARNLAHTGMKPLARLLLRLVHRHQDRARMTCLNEKWVEINPRDWDAEMDVRISPSVGRDDKSKKMGLLVQILQYQQSLIQQLGPNNPIVTIKEWRNTVSDIAALGDFVDSERYFRPVTPAVEAMMAQAAGGQQKADPNMLIAQAELAKAQAEAERIKVQAQTEIMKMELEREKLRLLDDRERDKAAMEFELRKAEIAAKHGAMVNQAAVDAEVNRDRMFAQELGKYARHVTPSAPAPEQMADPMLPPADPTMGGQMMPPDMPQQF